MRSFVIYIYNSFKCRLFYEIEKSGLERCWFDHYYELGNDGIFYFQAISKDGDRKFKVHISFNTREYEYFDDLVSLFKRHMNWIFKISEYNNGRESFDIIFEKPVYNRIKKEFYHISIDGINIVDIIYEEDFYASLNVNRDFDLISHLGGFNPLRDITVNEIREQLELPTITSRYPFDNTPRLSKPPIFNPPATICYWTDGTKSVVKCQEEDTYSPEAGLALCYMKKILGNTSRDLNKELHKYIPEEKGEE